MRNRSIQLGIVLILIVIYVVFIHSNSTVFTTNKHLNNKNKPTQYSLEHIVKGIGKHHIKLTPVIDESSDSFQLENVTPRIFSINGDKKHNLFVYVFESVNARKQAVGPYNEPYKNIFSAGYVPLGMYETWNVLIMEAEKQPVKSTELEELKPLHIEQIVFKDFNHGKVKQYVGETKNWKGTFTVKYYKHYWDDSDGKTTYDNVNFGQFVIHFKPKKGLKNIECEYKVGSRVGKMSGELLDKKGNINLNISDVEVPDPANQPTVTIKTGNSVENITFKEK